MENKKDNKKLLGILIPVVIVAIIGIIACFFLGGDDGYRMIQVYEVNGEAIIERPTVGNMDAYENLNLISGDKVTTKLKSYTRLKLDEDKYLLAEEDSIIELVATGDEKNSKTSINLLQGAVTIEVQNKLNANSTFEVTTPNSVMAVRGTVFRVKVEMDEKGRPITRVAIFEGAVGVQGKDENGNLGDEKFVPADQQAIIKIDDTQGAQVVLGDIDISDIPVEVLNFLKEIAEERRELTITLEEIEEAIKVVEDNQAPEDNNEIEDDSETEDDSEIENDSEAGNNSEPENNPQTGNNSQMGNNPDTGNDSEIEDDSKPEDETKPEGDSKPEDNPEKKVFTVTFTYKGNVFGTQEVVEGELASEPKLMPAPKGQWDFDFSKPITADTEIKFVE